MKGSIITLRLLGVATLTIIATMLIALILWSRYSTDYSFSSNTNLPKWSSLLHKRQTSAPQIVRVQPQENILNLALPKNDLLMDSIVALPEGKRNLGDLFSAENKEESVKVGGHLILDEKEPEPNAAIWDQVKGAEVQITIKTR